jgi:hypothetical protein
MACGNGGSGEAIIWDVSISAATARTGEMLSRLDEYTGNMHLGPNGWPESLGDERIERHRELEDALASSPLPPTLNQAIGWFLADPREQKISPLSNETTTKWVRQSADEFTPEDLQAAWEADPADAICLARRARGYAISEHPERYWAELYSKLSLELEPSDAEVCWRRVAVLALIGRLTEASAMADQAVIPKADNVWGWEAKLEACIELHRQADADATAHVVASLLRKIEPQEPTPILRLVREAKAAASRAASQPETIPAQ